MSKCAVSGACTSLDRIELFDIRSTTSPFLFTMFTVFNSTTHLYTVVICCFNMVSRSLFTAGAAAFSVMATVDATSYLKYSTVPGYFLQDIDTTPTDGFNYVRLYI